VSTIVETTVPAMTESNMLPAMSKETILNSTAPSGDEKSRVVLPARYGMQRNVHGEKGWPNGARRDIIVAFTIRQVSRGGHTVTWSVRLSEYAGLRRGRRAASCRP